MSEERTLAFRHPTLNINERIADAYDAGDEKQRHWIDEMCQRVEELFIMGDMAQWQKARLDYEAYRTKNNAYLYAHSMGRLSQFLMEMQKEAPDYGAIVQYLNDAISLSLPLNAEWSTIVSKELSPWFSRKL